MGWITEHVKAYPYNMSWRLYNNVVAFRKAFHPSQNSSEQQLSPSASLYDLPHIQLQAPSGPWTVCLQRRPNSRCSPPLSSPPRSPPLLSYHKAWEAAAGESDSRSAPCAEKVCKSYSKVRSGHRSQDSHRRQNTPSLTLLQNKEPQWWPSERVLHPSKPPNRLCGFPVHTTQQPLPKPLGLNLQHKERWKGANWILF